MTEGAAETRPTRATKEPRRRDGEMAGKYRLGHVIASGGMGGVVAALHETLGQPAAVKLLMPSTLADHAIDRFLREARAVAKLDSDHVVRVYDCGTLDDGLPYIAMERLVGHDLASELAARGTLPVEEA